MWFLGSYIMADFCSLYIDSLVWIKSIALILVFRHAKVLGWILLYAQYLDTKLGSIKI
jgi:hypothetical protein